ncbi:hypothetical protein J7G20_004341 [Vibrio parahaemolyticus]|nr:hypothetical protein [Vibrio parahaemolyticus]
MRFSSRFIKARGEQEIIFEDAPKKTRIGYYFNVLEPYLKSGRQGQFEPLDCYEVHEQFCKLIRDENLPWDYDDQDGRTSLYSHLLICDWFEFYDLVEMVAKALIEYNSDPFASDLYRYQGYQTKLNGLFEEDAVGWRLNESGELYRHIPEALVSRLNSVSSDIEAQYQPARAHYKKAVKFLYQHPIDPANAIKEIVSALESVARVQNTSASTLGEAIKQMKKKEQCPRLLLDSMDKLYAYANSTVRHGNKEVVEITLQEAELALHTGIAFIRYLIDSK